MANDIVLGSALRTNLLSLQSTQRNIDATQLRLATGKKVNSALDNPQSFFQAQSLNNRASDLTRLLDGIGQSVRTLEEADKGITALTSLVEQASSIAESARSEILASEGFASVTGTVDLRGVTDLTASGAITANDDIKISFYSDAEGLKAGGDINIAAGSDVYDLVAAINGDTTNDINKYVRASVDPSGRLKIESLKEGGLVRIADGTTSPGTDGFAALGLDSVVTSENANATTTTRQAGTLVPGRTLTSGAADAASKVNGEYVSSATLATADFVAGYATGGADDLEISLRIDDQTIALGDFTDSSSIQSVIDAVNTKSDGKATASFNTSTGKIEVQFAEDVGSAEIIFESEAAGDIAFGFGTGITGYGGAGGANDVSLTAGQISSEAFTFIGSSANLTQFRDDYNNLREQINDLVKDANYRGVNLLSGDNLTTYFNEDRSSTLVTEGADFTASGLGLAEVDFLDAGDVQEATDATRNALDAVRKFGSSISNDLSIIQTRQDFTEQTITTLKSGASDLTDADPNEEGANLLALQTRQQLGVTSLSLASQSQQSVLRLF